MKIPGSAQLLLIATIIPVLIVSSFCQVVVAESEPYSFPTKPGSDQWRGFTHHDQMVAACQLPVDVLQTLTTPALVLTCLQYPLLPDMFAFNTLPTGLSRVSDRFNGLQELVQRSTAGHELLVVYSELTPAQVAESISDGQSGIHAFHFVFIEILMSQPAVLAGLDSDDIQASLQEGLTKYYGQQALPQFFGGISLDTTCFLMGRVLMAVEYSPFLLQLQQNPELTTFLQTGQAIAPDILARVVDTTEQFLDEANGNEGER